MPYLDGKKSFINALSTLSTNITTSPFIQAADLMLPWPIISSTKRGYFEIVLTAQPGEHHAGSRATRVESCLDPARREEKKPELGTAVAVMPIGPQLTLAPCINCLKRRTLHHTQITPLSCP